MGPERRYMREADYYNMADEALVSLSHEGDALADEVLCERYKNLVRIKARPYFLIGADREDLIQEGMIGLYKAVRDYTPDHNTGFRSFAEMCILRQIITAIKGATRKKHAPLNSYVSFFSTAFADDDQSRPLLDTMLTVGAENPEDVFISKESAQTIAQGIQKLLTPLEKQVLELFMEGRSYQEIAQHIGCGTKTVDNALQRIKKKLEKHIHDS